MRNNWNRPVYLSALMLAITAGAVACSEHFTAPQRASTVSENLQVAQQRLDDLEAKYGWTGKYHTAVLGYVYARLSTSNRAAAKPEKCRIALLALKEFDKSFSRDGKSRGIADDFLSNEICNDLAEGSVIQPKSETRLKGAPDLSARARSMLLQIQSSLDGNPSVPTLASKIRGIDSAATADLSPSEAGAVVSLGSIAISSAQYWGANLGRWRSASSFGPVSSTQLSTGKGPSATVLGLPPRQAYDMAIDPILKADAGAFLSSLLLGWWAGVVDLEVSAVRAAIASIIAGILMM